MTPVKPRGRSFSIWTGHFLRILFRVHWFRIVDENPVSQDECYHGRAFELGTRSGPGHKK